MNIKETKKRIFQAGRKAVNELIKVAEEKIITNTEDDVSADRLKNAAATKKLARFDAFEILNRIQEEENLLEGKTPEETKKTTISRLNKGKKWKYGYNKEHDIIVISKTGKIGEIYEIQNLKIALPSVPVQVHIMCTCYICWCAIVVKPETFFSSFKLFVYVIIPLCFIFFRVRSPVKYIFKST